MTDRPDLSWITREWFHDFDDPHVINEGWCFVWAWLAHLAYPGAQLATVNLGGPFSILAGTVSHHAHAIIRIEGRWYDSRSFRGRVRWREMPTIKSEEPWGFREQTPGEFIACWAPNGPRAWDDQGLYPWLSALPTRRAA